MSGFPSQIERRAEETAAAVFGRADDSPRLLENFGWIVFDTSIALSPDSRSNQNQQTQTAFVALLFRSQQNHKLYNLQVPPFLSKAQSRGYFGHCCQFFII